MSVVDRYKHGANAGKRWQVRWRDDNGAQRKRSFDRKVAAEQWDAKVRAELAAGSYVDPTNKTTVGEAALRWLELRPHRPSTARRMKGLVRNHIVDQDIGKRRLGQVRPSEVQAWARDRGQVLGPAVLRQLVSTLRSVYDGAVQDRLVGANPVTKRMPLPSVERERLVPLTVEQVQALAAAMPPAGRAMVLTQAGLGLRIGELIGLTVAHVDFLRRTVRIDSQVDDEGRRVELKTRGSRRTLPLPQLVADALAAHLADNPPGRDGLIFHTRLGTPYPHMVYGYRWFKAALAAAGLPPAVTPHDLRHFYASALLAAGEDVATVAGRLGHLNATLVLTTYGHMMPGREDRTRRAIDEALSAPDVPREGRNRT